MPLRRLRETAVHANVGAPPMARCTMAKPRFRFTSKRTGGRQEVASRPERIGTVEQRSLSADVRGRGREMLLQTSEGTMIMLDVLVRVELRVFHVEQD